MERRVERLEQMAAFARAFCANLIPRESGATLVGLSGELGAGKTTFVQGVARALGVAETVTSPTFVIMKIYQLQGQSFERLVHVDAYRLESGGELLALQFEDLLRDPKNLILLEWPERVSDALPKDRITLSFKVVDESAREISYDD